ncbi:MAG: hypothetical protein ABJB86_02150 [Bacteroidota bacterium]
MTKYLHIVCPEIPNPSSAADTTDTYFQLQFLHEAGYQVMLHCFHDETNTDTTHLENITAQIHLYERNQGHKGVSIRHPYCISSRSNPLLLENLFQHFCPVLFQGTTATFCLPELVEKGYKIIVRINGIASELYESNTKCEKSLLKKAYAFNEARLIRKWEEKISEHAIIITTTISDQQKFQQLYKGARTAHIASFLPVPEIKSKPGTGMYCLYFGDMMNPENEKMVHWLSDNIFRKITVPLIVADICSTIKLQDQPHHPESNICMVSNPSEEALTELIQKAQIVLLPRCHNSGFDKRLLQALEKGRHCICNDVMIHDTGLEKLFILASDNEEIIDAINIYFSQPFTDQDICERKALLCASYTARKSLNEFVKIIDE